MPYSRKRKYGASAAVDPLILAARRAKGRATRRFNAPIRKAGRAANMAYMKQAIADHGSLPIPYQQLMAAHNLTQPQLMKIMGKGGYWGRRFGNWISDALGLAHNSTIRSGLVTASDAGGDLLASRIPYGSAIAAGAEQIAKLTGNGRYDLNQPMPQASAVPSFDSSGGDVTTVRMRNREYLGAVAGSSAFTLRTLRLNPGDVQTFPQLSKVAQFYDEYRFHGLVFYFKSTSGETSSNADTAIGTVMMASTCDPMVAAPQNKTQLVRLDMNSEGKPSQDQAHGIECAAAGIKYVRHGSPGESSRDGVFFDEGNFHIATEGQPAGVTRIGELWVSYDIELLRPRDDQGQGTPMYYGVSSTAVNVTNNVMGSQVRAINTLPIALAGNTMTWPQYVTDGDYIVTLRLANAILADTPWSARAPAPTTNSFCTVLYFDNLAESSGISTSGYNGPTGAQFGLNSRAVFQYYIRVNAPGTTQAVLTFGSDGVAPTVGGGYAQNSTGTVFLTVIQVPTLPL